MTDLTPRQGPGTRQQFLSAMLAELVRTKTADGPFRLSTRAVDDPTVALLDAWATIADVIAFYQRRIADEGFVGTATQAGSLLAIAQLTGYTPRPGLAASLWLAYNLHPDPSDTPVILPTRLLAQSVPGTGELPQTFETTEELVARPSWNTLGVQTTGPVTAPDGVAALTTLAFKGATTGLAANDAIVLLRGGDPPPPPAPVMVQSVSVDMTNQITTVTLQPQMTGTASANGEAATAVPAPPGASAPAALASEPGTPITEAIDKMLPALRAQPARPPASAAALNRDSVEVFSPGSGTVVADNVVRLVAALNPTLAGSVYKALGTTPIGPATVTDAQAMQVRGTPFGVRMPPRPVFDSRGQQIGADEWPIGDMQILTAQIMVSDGAPINSAQISVQGPGGILATAAVDIARLPSNGQEVTVPLAQAGTLGTVGTAHIQRPTGGITVSFEPAPSQPLGTMTVTLRPETVAGSYTVGITFTRGTGDPDPGDSNEFTWVPGLQAAQHFTVGNQRVAISWQAVAPVAGPGQSRESAGMQANAATLLTVSVAQALPIANPQVLDLDTIYPGIVPGSWVVINGPPPATKAAGLPYPLVAKVTSAMVTAVSRYGMSGTVTELTLNSNWIDPTARWLSAVRPLTVQAQPAPLTLLPVALPAPITGSTIDLDGLYSGIQAGQRILVTGTRVDLPGMATVPGGEPAMVSGVTQTTAGAGDAVHTTLQLSGNLAYAYDRASVRIYGNVIPAHHGATLNEPLTGATPGDPHPTFTLSQAPVLADPSTTGSGYVSTLQLSVNGIVWTPVARLDASAPASSYLVGIDSQGRTTITLSGPLPTGTSSVMATYRAGYGRAGNVRAHQVTQLLSRPLTVASVDNPLPGGGGSAGDGPAELQAGASVGLTAIGRIVTADDVTDLALAWSGVSKAGTASTTDGSSEVVALTVAGVDPVDLASDGPVCTGLAAAIAAIADPSTPVVVVPANLYLIVLAAAVRCDPAFDWTNVSKDLQTALFSAFGYSQRHLGQDVVISEILAVAQAIPGVDSLSVSTIAFVATTASATEIFDAITNPVPLPSSGRVSLPTPAPPASGPPAQCVAFLSDALTDTVILQQVLS